MYDLITIGDSNIDAFALVNEAEVVCDPKSHTCDLCVNYGGKVPVEKIAFCTAGNACNVAMGTSRLGLKTAIYTEIGQDNNGKMLIEGFNEEGISLDFVQARKDSATNQNFVISYKGERTIFVYHHKREYKLPDFGGEPPFWVYYTSLSADFANLQSELVGYIEGNPGVKVAFNPGTLHLAAGREHLVDILPHVEVIFLNREEAAKLSGLEKEDMRSLHNFIYELGPRITVITDGANGASAFDGDRFFQIGLHEVPVVESTGVGDAFASAFISALYYNEPVEKALVWGTLNSAGVIQKIGARDGLMSRRQVEELLARNPQFTLTHLIGS